MDLIKCLNVYVMFISEMKIDVLYLNNCFMIFGFFVYWNDCKKGGGGVMVIVLIFLESKCVSIKKNYKILEFIVVEVKMKRGNVIMFGIYCLLKNFCGEYWINLENELSDICNWVSL